MAGVGVIEPEFDANSEGWKILVPLRLIRSGTEMTLVSDSLITCDWSRTAIQPCDDHDGYRFGSRTMNIFNLHDELLYVPYFKLS